MNKKLFEVDVDSEEDLLKLINLLKSKIGSLRSGTSESKAGRRKEIFDACQAIFETNIAEVYGAQRLDQNPIYYVYAHSEPSKNIAIGKCGKSTFGATIGMAKLPFYIGKGTGARAFDLNRNETHRKVRQKLHKFGQEVEVTIIKDHLTELEALMLESKLIDIFGLIPEGGRLVNLDEGVNAKSRRELYRESLRKLSSLYKNSV